jgi:hypothetical protein
VRAFLISLTLPFWFVSGAIAGDLPVPVSIARGWRGNIPTIAIDEGAGMNISIAETGGTIEAVFLDDPSFIGLKCETKNCRGASYIHLTRIRYVNYRASLPPPRARTLLTVISRNAAGKSDRFQFRIKYGKSPHTSVTIVPDVTPPTTSVVDRERVRNGLAVARSRGLISAEQGNEGLPERVAVFLEAIESEPLAAAAETAGVSIPLIRALERLGSQPLPVPDLGPPFQTIPIPALPR